MRPANTIRIFEYDFLRVGEPYQLGTDPQRHKVFTEKHLQLLSQYLTTHPECQFYTLYLNKVRFQQFVGVIKVGDLTIEVLPKTDRHTQDKEVWQKVLLDMLLISLQVQAKTTNNAHITIRQHSVLETYLQLFLDEAEKLIHQGLVKKYCTNVSNQTALKGKLLVHQQITKNAVHAERFYVAHSVYDRDNVYNYILRAALECIVNVGSESLSRSAQALLLFFPECKPVAINEKLFQRLTYDRKTEGYRVGIELARIILLNYHPGIKDGSNDILAIMFDMNYLWESFIYWSLRKAARDREDVIVLGQSTAPFWVRDKGGWPVKLQPDIWVSIGEEKQRRNVIIDTKWKYQSKPSPEDLRQLYAYQHYFAAQESFLLYPDRIDEADKLKTLTGNFYKTDGSSKSELGCGLMFADLLERDEKRNEMILNREIGAAILKLLVASEEAESE